MEFPNNFFTNEFTFQLCKRVEFRVSISKNKGKRREKLILIAIKLIDFPPKN